MHVLVLTIEWSYYVHGTNTIILSSLSTNQPSYHWHSTSCPWSMWQNFVVRSLIAMWTWAQKHFLQKRKNISRGDSLSQIRFYIQNINFTLVLRNIFVDLTFVRTSPQNHRRIANCLAACHNAVPRALDACTGAGLLNLLCGAGNCGEFGVRAAKWNMTHRTKN